MGLQALQTQRQYIDTCSLAGRLAKPPSQSCMPSGWQPAQHHLGITGQASEQRRQPAHASMDPSPRTTAYPASQAPCCHHSTAKHHTFPRSTSGAGGSVRARAASILCRSMGDGKPQYSRRSRRPGRSRAASMRSGREVAAITHTPAHKATAHGTSHANRDTKETGAACYK